MISLECTDCKSPLEWKGKGRKPKRCAPCKKKASRAAHSKVVHRIRRHGQDKPVSRWGDIWLTDGKAIRREARYVWGATGEADETVTNRSGVFHYAGPDGLPDMGLTVSDADGCGDVRHRILENARLAKESDEAVAWLGANHNWWKFEEFAHESFARDVTDSAMVHGGDYEDAPDETSHKHRCSFCCERKPLVLAAEFCSADCLTDYVRAFGPDGLDLSGGPGCTRHARDG
ncbi:hypothetical protein [Spirillospora sp. CA-294931]|uniref:hypothetical protein n=1 Tax=Spirillospora sp. CA-294931 TaxID=3240042 RepID=UPI003D93AF25